MENGLAALVRRPEEAGPAHEMGAGMWETYETCQAYTAPRSEEGEGRGGPRLEARAALPYRVISSDGAVTVRACSGTRLDREGEM